MGALSKKSARDRLGTNLKKYRVAKGWTQEELAREASKGLPGRRKVSREYITQLETSARSNPSLAVLLRIAGALGVPVHSLLE